jgi:hypothetical protein
MSTHRSSGNINPEWPIVQVFCKIFCRPPSRRCDAQPPLRGSAVCADTTRFSKECLMPPMREVPYLGSWRAAREATQQSVFRGATPGDWRTCRPRLCRASLMNSKYTSLFRLAGPFGLPAFARRRRVRGAPPTTHMDRMSGLAFAPTQAFAADALTFSHRAGSRAHPTRLPDSRADLRVRCVRVATQSCFAIGPATTSCGGVRRPAAHPVATPLRPLPPNRAESNLQFHGFLRHRPRRPPQLLRRLSSRQPALCKRPQILHIVLRPRH